MEGNNSTNRVSRASLAEGYTISRIIKGGWQLAEGHSRSRIEKQQAIADMFKFAESGVTTFDCADIYTGVEELIGLFRREYEKKFGRAALTKLQMHTKFVPDLSILSEITKKYVESVIDRSLSRLQMEQVDLVQFHWWDYDIPGYMEMARLLADIQKKGKIKYLWTTNFDTPHVKEFVENGVKIVAQQIQYSILDRRPENGMVDFCQDNGIGLLCYGTVAGGFLAEKYMGAPEPKEPFENRSLIKYKLIIDEFGGWQLFQELLGVLSTIAEKHGVSVTNVAIRYVLEKPQVAGIIIGAQDSSYLKDNLRAFELSLDQEDAKCIESVLKEAKGPEGDTYSLERVKGGKHASIMKYNLNKQ